MKTDNSHLKQHSLNSLWSPNMPKLLLSNAPVIWNRDQYFLTRLIIPKWEYFRNFKISSKWFFYLLPCSGPQLSRQNKKSRHYKLYSRQNRINLRQNRINLRQNKINSRKNKINPRQNKENELVSGWSAVVICIWNGTWCNSNQTKWRPLLLRIVEG